MFLDQFDVIAENFNTKNEYVICFNEHFNNLNLIINFDCIYLILVLVNSAKMKLKSRRSNVTSNR